MAILLNNKKISKAKKIRINNQSTIEKIIAAHDYKLDAIITKYYNSDEYDRNSAQYQADLDRLRIEYKLLRERIDASNGNYVLSNAEILILQDEDALFDPNEAYIDILLEEAQIELNEKINKCSLKEKAEYFLSEYNRLKQERYAADRIQKHFLNTHFTNDLTPKETILEFGADFREYLEQNNPEYLI